MIKIHILLEKKNVNENNESMQMRPSKLRKKKSNYLRRVQHWDAITHRLTSKNKHLIRIVSSVELVFVVSWPTNNTENSRTHTRHPITVVLWFLYASLSQATSNYRFQLKRNHSVEQCQLTANHRLISNFSFILFDPKQQLDNKTSLRTLA